MNNLWQRKLQTIFFNGLSLLSHVKEMSGDAVAAMTTRRFEHGSHPDQALGSSPKNQPAAMA